MPLFVPVLRLSMLFLNVYDSYKILKPPPSSRNGGMPSQRALQQRKRNMKGCIAVWIVWCCFTMYERLAEGVISLFVPFYDEVKSLFLLFLIFTRARGAEPIFLHIIRPLLKPYTATLDILLDLICMTGDIIFVLCTTPFRMVWNWWENSVFNLNIGTLDSEPSSAMDQSIISFTHVQASYPSPPAERSAAEAPRRTGSVHQANRQSGFRSKDRRAASQGETHRIWNPPSTTYDDDDDSNDSELRIQTTSDRNSIPLKSSVIAGRQEIEEWREYPPFPSAYPATPLVVSSSLINTAITSNHVTTEVKVLSDVPEELSKQGFPKSLLPPRKPLDPDLDGGLSDDSSNIGVNSIANDDMSVDSVIETDEEDEFNTTLRTPLPPLGSVRSQVPPIPLAVRSISKASSVASRSTALTTTGYTASLRSRSSAESLSSAAVPASDVTSLVGTKRPLPASMTDSGTWKSRPRPAESSGPSKGTIRGKLAPKTVTKSSIKPATTLPRSDRRKSGDAAAEESQRASTKSDEESAGDRKGSSHTTKRRKVVSSSFRAGHLNRTVRPKAAIRGSGGLSATSRTQAVKPGNEVSHRSTHPLSGSSAKS